MRPAKLSDAGAIAKVLKSGYNLDSLDEAKGVFLSERKRGVRYIVADADGKIVGLVTWTMHGLPKHGLIELDRIAVLPEFRGKGVSRQLFGALIDDARKEYEKEGKKLRKLYLMTHESNKRAQSFYEKMGMKHEATLKAHFYDKEDERVYGMFF